MYYVMRASAPSLHPYIPIHRESTDSLIYHKIKNQNLSPEPCTESEVRLNNEVVQICHNQQWTPVCSFSNSAAEVVCNQVEIPSRC